MNKPRKYNGVYKLPIKKHTKVRRPISRWQLEYMLFENNPVLISNTLKMSVPPIKVNDISIGLENPLETACIYDCSCASSRLLPSYRYHLPSCYSLANFLPQHNKGDWNKDMEEQVPDNIFTQNKGAIDKYWPKPSLLTRVKERFKR